MFLSEQVGDSENVRENFKKIKNYLEAVTASGSGEVIFFTSVDSLVLDWTLTRKDLFGDFPSTEIWIDFNGVYYKDDVPGIMDAPPPSLTTITFDFLGNTGAQGTGFLIIGNGGDTSTISSVAWGTLTGTLSAQTDLQAALNLKLNTSDYNQHFVGKYTTLAALQAAFPTANAGDYGQVDTGSGHDVVNYNYDIEDGWIEGGSGSGATNTDSLPEGSTNLYFTSARVLSAAAFGTAAGTYAQGNDSRILDGETAFTWGNHAGAGYLTSASSLAWAKITGAPTTLSGYGITDAYSSSNPAGYISSVPAQSFSSLTGKPTTLSGYGITDAYPLTGNPSGFLTSVPAQSFSSLTGKPTTISGYGITDAGTIANGGTGLTTYATGDILYASAANVLSKLSAGTNGYVLTLASGLPTWAAASGGASLWMASGSDIYYNSGKVGIGITTPQSLLHLEAAPPYSANYLLSSNDVYGLNLTNSQAATASQPLQSSPAIILKSQVYAGGVSSTYGFRIQCQGRQINFSSNSGGSNYTSLFQIGDGGSVNAYGSITSSSYGAFTSFTQSSRHKSNSTIGLNTIAFNLYDFLSTSGIYNNYSTGSFGSVFNSFIATPIINNIVGTTIVRGVYLNPTLTNIVGTTLIGFQNETGNNLFGTTSGSVGIGATTTIGASRILQVVSTTKASSPFPPMTTSQRTALTPVESDGVYDTTLHKLYIYDGTSWNACW